jgi:hypothetical protein
MPDVFQTQAGRVAVFSLPDDGQVAFFDLLDKNGQAVRTVNFVLTSPEFAEAASHRVTSALNGAAYMQTGAKVPGTAALSGFLFANADCRGGNAHKGFVEFLDFYDRYNVSAQPGREPVYLQMRTGSARLRLFITAYRMSYVPDNLRFEFSLQAVVAR